MKLSEAIQGDSGMPLFVPGRMPWYSDGTHVCYLGNAVFVECQARGLKAEISSRVDQNRHPCQRDYIRIAGEEFHFSKALHYLWPWVTSQRPAYPNIGVCSTDGDKERLLNLVESLEPAEVPVVPAPVQRQYEILDCQPALEPAARAELEEALV